MWAVARRPRWIGALVLALAIAAIFAALGQWQIERSVEQANPVEVATETRVPLNTIAQPQQTMKDSQQGQLVSLDAEYVADDYIVLSDRTNLADPGYWVVGHAITDGASVAVALGWTDSADAAESAIRTLQQSPPSAELTGRYLPTEAPTQSDFENGVRSALAVPELVNLWSTPADGVYSGYVISDDAPAGLDAIDSPSPITEVSLNLLNIFYAVEWVIFAGFAIFLWYRLVRDTWEDENAALENGSEETRQKATVE
jgi:cytochrome oxidase assembly protein ShyY1